MSGFFKGNIAIKFDPTVVCNIMQMDPMVKVLSLDEDNSNPMLNADINPQVILASILLPPVEALWAIADNDEDKFQLEYFKHLQSPEATDFFFTIIAAAYMGAKIIFYYPDPDTDSIKYLYNYFMKVYGIHISFQNEVQDPFWYDPKAVPTYLNGIYGVGAIDGYDYLRQYPVEEIMPDQIIMKLIVDIRPLGDCIQDQIEVLRRLHKKLKEKPYALCPLVIDYSVKN